MHHAEPDSEVNDAAENDWSQNAHGKFCDDLAEEVGAHGVHVVVDFSQEDRPLVREDQDDVLDRVEGDGHRDEEERAVSVLDALGRAVDVLEEDDREYSGDDRHYELHVGGLR